MTRVEDFATLTFGLLDGWWLSKDPERRLPNGPLLSPHAWRAALAAAGFDRVETLAPGAAAQTILFARRAATPAATAAKPTPKTPKPATTKPATPITAIIRKAVAAALDTTPGRIDPGTPFGDMGVDSIVSPQIAETINEALNITLRSTDLYNFATVEALARHITETFPDAKAGSAFPPPSFREGPGVGCQPPEPTPRSKKNPPPNPPATSP